MFWEHNFEIFRIFISYSFKPLVHTVGAQLKKKDSDYVVTLHLPLVRIQEKKRPFGRRSK